MKDGNKLISLDSTLSFPLIDIPIIIKITTVIAEQIPII